MKKVETTQQKMTELLSKHTTFRDDFRATVTGWEKVLQNAIAVQSFGENDIIKKVRGGLAKEIQEINNVLLYKDVLTEQDRMRLLDKRSMYMQFLNLFRNAEITIENMDKTLESELNELKN